MLSFHHLSSNAGLLVSGHIVPVTASKKRATKNYVYPDATPGSDLAKKVRAKANKLSDAKRHDLFQRGMQIIYGGSSVKETVGSGQ